MRWGVILWGLLFVWPIVASADATLDRLSQALRLEEIVEILQQEGMSYGEELDELFLGGDGGEGFQNSVRQLFSPNSMLDDLQFALSEGMDQSEQEQAALFFESEVGRKIIGLENSARRAISDPEIMEVAKSLYTEANRDSSFFRLIDEYVRTNDLVRKNLDASVLSDINFVLGMVEGRGIPADQGAIVSSLLAQRDEMREDTETWLFGFLLMAYQPLTPYELRENIAFSGSSAGRALNEALFAGFDAFYVRVHYELGHAVGRAMAASDL